MPRGCRYRSIKESGRKIHDRCGLLALKALVMRYLDPPKAGGNPKGPKYANKGVFRVSELRTAMMVLGIFGIRTLRGVACSSRDATAQDVEPTKLRRGLTVRKPWGSKQPKGGPICIF